MVLPPFSGLAGGQGGQRRPPPLSYPPERAFFHEQCRRKCMAASGALRVQARAGADAAPRQSTNRPCAGTRMRQSARVPAQGLPLAQKGALLQRRGSPLRRGPCGEGPGAYPCAAHPNGRHKATGALLFDAMSAILIKYNREHHFLRKDGGRFGAKAPCFAPA